MEKGEGRRRASGTAYDDVLVSEKSSENVEELMCCDDHQVVRIKKYSLNPTQINFSLQHWKR